MIPEKFGGMELDITAMMVAAEHFAGDASWSGWQSAHVGIGTLPLLFFGNEQQKRSIAELANVEMLAAYATEPHAILDALAARTRMTFRRMARTTSSTARNAGSPMAEQPISRSSPRWAARSSPPSWWSAPSA